MNRPGAPVLPALPPVPSELAETLPAAFAPAGSSQDPASGVPIRALEAYRHAAAIVDAADPACQVDWALVAAIGKVESDHGRYAGNAIDGSGVVRPGIYGLPLNGHNNTATVFDSDGGLLDRDTQWDRAVGPMQFIPTTWDTVGVDADGDGTKDPQNISDAATATAVYLCSGPGDLTQPTDLRAAVLRYNQSDAYVQQVVAIADAYRRGVTALPATALTSAQLDAAPYLPSGEPQVSLPARRRRPPSSGQPSSGASSSGSSGDSGSRDSGDSGDSGGAGGSSPQPQPSPSPTSPGVVGHADRHRRVRQRNAPRAPPPRRPPRRPRPRRRPPRSPRARSSASSGSATSVSDAARPGTLTAPARGAAAAIPGSRSVWCPEAGPTWSALSLGIEAVRRAGSAQEAGDHRHRHDDDQHRDGHPPAKRGGHRAASGTVSDRGVVVTRRRGRRWVS